MPNDGPPQAASPERRQYDVQVVTGGTVAIGDVIRSSRTRALTVERLTITTRVGFADDPLLVAHGTSTITDPKYGPPVEFPSKDAFYAADFIVIDQGGAR